MDFIEIKNKFIALNRVRYIDLVNDDNEYSIMFQFEMDDNYTVIYFDDSSEFDYWLDYLRKKINC